MLTFDLIQSLLAPEMAVTVTLGSISETFINSVAENWQTRSLLFTASSPDALLTFAGPTSGAIDDPLAHIDNVGITQTVPAPLPFLLFLWGLPYLKLRKRSRCE
jgi:hypothetical protein